MAVISNSAVSEVCRTNEFKFCTAHQRLYVLRKQAYTVGLPVENVSSVCLVNSKQRFTLQLVYKSMLIMVALCNRADHYIFAL